MSDYIIITDSSCDLPHSLVQELELTVLPLSFIMDGKTYRNWPDNRDMSPDEFYSKEREGLTVQDLLEKFKAGAGKNLDNDRILLS